MLKFAEIPKFFPALSRHYHASRMRRNEVQALGQKLRFKLRTQGKLNLVERHLLRSFPDLDRTLCGPSFSSTLESITRGLLKPAFKCALSGFILVGASWSFPAKNNWRGISQTKIAQAEVMTAPVKPELEIPKLAMAIADESAPLALALETNVDFRAPSSYEDQTPLSLQTKVASPAPAAPAAPELQTIKAQVQLSNQRGLVKFISGIIAAFRPTIGDCGEIARHIVEISELENIDPIYVASVIAVESRFSSTAQSGAGARGLMQLMPTTAREIAKSASHKTAHLTDPKTNIRLGIHYLKQLEGRYRGNRFLALSAYNWGPANVDSTSRRYQGIPGSVRKYSNTVIERTLSWRRHYDKATQGANAIQTAIQPAAASKKNS